MEFLKEHELDLVLIGWSVLCGSLMGFEREYRNKSAGFRTIILICLGSTLFTLVSVKVGAGDRIAANIITGVGFIGAGVIYKDGFNVGGLTTAAVIWIAAAVGMALGLNNTWLGLVVTAVTIIVLSLFHYAEVLIDIVNNRKMFQIRFVNGNLENLYEVEDLIRSRKLKSRRRELGKKQDKLFVKLEAIGNKQRIKVLTEQLVALKCIEEM